MPDEDSAPSGTPGRPEPQSPVALRPDRPLVAATTSLSCAPELPPLLKGLIGPDPPSPAALRPSIVTGGPAGVSAFAGESSGAHPARPSDPVFTSSCLPIPLVNPLASAEPPADNAAMERPPRLTAESGLGGTAWAPPLRSIVT